MYDVYVLMLWHNWYYVKTDSDKGIVSAMITINQLC